MYLIVFLIVIYYSVYFLIFFVFIRRIVGRYNNLMLLKIVSGKFVYSLFLWCFFKRIFREYLLVKLKIYESMICRFEDD